ncbi:Mn2+ and Fe2+ transporters of the NRAMP family [Nonomuraea maritima]|uniref:Mn2+ and Fe2+ transporters of the NRAMP family n=1 Tax=Nonomuraea maritima TaxID=683260 RepID=A0A1G9FFQ5_9ACTN|nr:Nramp family divalent metal transporter [Nonomuraea maritima]SDK87281.1 Mn2+ and Fe2+ transporters of the NRAMP family [Nonomuraea maritima]
MAEFTPTVPARVLPPVHVRDLPEPPSSTWRIIGPGLVGAGVGLASGEFILWPYIASQVGLVFIWGAAIGIITQWFLNMEIERYTLATGETALTGFSRMWKHWGLVFVLMTLCSNLWPGWVTTSATMVTYLTGSGQGAVRWIAIGMLLLIALGLTLAPVIYTILERVIFVKIALVATLAVVAVLIAINAESWVQLGRGLTVDASFPIPPLDFAVLMGAIAYAGAGGGQNLCQSNWIRDKGFGMGLYVPRLVSPVTGHEEAASSTGYQFPPTAENLARWKRWWRFANIEQAWTFAVVAFVTIALMSMLAYSTVFGRPGLENSIAFLEVEGQVLMDVVGPWFGVLFWLIGALALFASAMGIVDYTSRLASDTIKTVYLRDKPVSVNRVYFAIVWGMALLGTAILLLGFDQPLILLVFSACFAAVMMFVYSILLIVLNRRALPQALKVRSYRLGALIWSVAFFGTLTVLVVIQQARQLFGG